MTESFIIEFRKDGTVSDNFDQLICAKCGASLELYEVYNDQFIVVCSHAAENPEPFEEGHTSFEVPPGIYRMNRNGEIQD